MTTAGGVIETAPETRMDCGWRLAKLSARLLRGNRRLWLLAIAIAAASLFSAGAPGQLRDASGVEVPLLLLVVVALAAVVSFLTVAAIFLADAEIDDEPFWLRDALAESWALRATVLQWALLASGAQLGLYLLSRLLDERAQLTIGLVGFAWVISVTFVLPVIALQGERAIEAVRESWRLFAIRWGELSAGWFGIGGLLVLCLIPFAIAFGAGESSNVQSSGSGDLAAVVGTVGIVVLCLVAFAVGLVFSVAVYRDATVGMPGAPFVERRPRRRSWPARIGIALASLLLAIAVIGSLINPVSGPSEFKTRVPSDDAQWVTVGMPVVYESETVGEVKASYLDDGDNFVVFSIDESHRHLRGSTYVTLWRFQGQPCLLLVPNGERPGSPDPAATDI